MGEGERPAGKREGQQVPGGNEGERCFVTVELGWSRLMKAVQNGANYSPWEGGLQSQSRRRGKTGLGEEAAKKAPSQELF